MSAVDPSEGRLPHVFLVGSMKCGTTTLYGHLEKHPQICGCRVKEPEFFIKDFNESQLHENYLSLFEPNQEVHRCLLEGSTVYSKYPQVPGVPERIHRAGFDSKFLYMIRNPFSRIESHWNFMQRDWHWKLDIADEHLVNVSRYFMQLQQYRKYFHADQIHIVDFDQMKQSPQSVLEGIGDFLRIDSNLFGSTLARENTTKQESAAVTRIHSSPLYAPVRLLPAPIRQIGKTVLHRIAPPKARRSLTALERESITTRLQDDMQSLSQEYGVDVGRWGF